MPNNEKSSLAASAPAQRTGHLQPSDIAHDELHRAAFATLDIGVWKYDILRQKMSWGAEVEAILGVRPSSSPEETFFGLMHADDRPNLMAEFQKCLQYRQPFRLNYRITRVDGAVRWMTSTGQPYFDQDGRPTHVIGTVVDITEQRLAQQWLHAQNDVLRLIALGVPAREVFQAIVQLLGSGLDVSMVALLQPDGQGRLRLIAGANVPEDYLQAIEAITTDSDNCLCIQSVLEAQPLFSAQLSTDPRAEALRPMIEKHHWGSCCTFPILAMPNESDPPSLFKPLESVTNNEQVVGLFALYRSQPGQPNEKELEKIAQAAHLANIVIARDRTHQSLRESEHRFRELANAMPQLVWANDAQGNGNYGNRLLKETIGQQGMDNWLSVIHPDDQQQTIERFSTALQTGQPYTSEHRMRVLGTQTYRWFLARSVPSRDAAGNITSWYGAATDIEDLKRIESELREERDRLTAIAATSPSVLFTYMELPDGTPTLPYAAPSISELLGMDFQLLRSDPRLVFERIEATDLQQIRKLQTEAEATMDSMETTFRIQHPIKGVVWVECQASPCRLADGQICWHGTLTDITRRKMLEARFLQSEKLEAIGRLAGGIAHDFNNMLTVIISACHVLELQRSDQAAETENIDAIRQAALRAAALTKQLLAFSRQQPTLPQQLNLNAVITQAEVILQRLVGKSIQLNSDLADNLRLVFVDPSQVEQILVNLVINSRDAIEREGRIHIVTRNVTKISTGPSNIASNLTREYVEFSVTDSGCGMSPETQAHVFEPFYTTKPIGKGTGLGLAVVHGIVTQNEGMIEVESAAQVGTTFRILLPAIEPQNVGAGASRASGVLQGGTEGVLVVDDEPAIGKMTAKTLRSLGYFVFIANSPDEAARLFAANSQSIDILLTDLLMPGCNGVELAGQLIQAKPDLRVIVMSGHRTSSFDHSDVARTGYRFLPKPYTTIELSSALRAVIDGSA